MWERPTPIDDGDVPWGSLGAGKDLYYRSAILVLLTEQGGHGDDLLGRMAELGFERRTAMTLSRVLGEMEDEGLVSSSWLVDAEGARHQVRKLTAKGTASLRDIAPVMIRQRYAMGVMLDRYRALSRHKCRAKTS